MLIRCCFAIIVMVDTISSTLSQNSLKFLPAFGTIHHVFLQHLNFYLDHATFFPAHVWDGIHENFILAFSCALCACVYIYIYIYIYTCMHIFLVE